MGFGGNLESNIAVIFLRFNKKNNTIVDLMASSCPLYLETIIAKVTSKLLMADEELNASGMEVSFW